MNLRRLIYLSAKPSTELRQYFEERDWDVKAVRSSKDAKKAADDAEAAGGLLDLAAGLPSHEIEALETGLSMPNVGWVAIVSPGQLGPALGSDIIKTLAQRSGLSEEELAKQLSQVLPGVVDKLTPAGRLPDPSHP